MSSKQGFHTGAWIKSWLWLLWVPLLIIIVVIFRTLKSSITWFLVGVALIFVGAILGQQAYTYTYGSTEYVYAEIGAFVGSVGLVLVIVTIIRGIIVSIDQSARQKQLQKNERARFLMMSHDEAQRYIDSVQDPQLRMKLIKDWQRNHVSTQL